MLFTRQPDYFDSEKTAGTIVQKQDKMLAEFSDGRTTRYASVPYPFLHRPGERVVVIYEASDPAAAKQYGVLGYWIRFGELIASLLIVVVMYYIAVSITSNPTPEALMEEMEASKPKPRGRKYVD